MSAARAVAPEHLRDVQELLGFVRDDGLQFLRGVLVPFNYVDK